MPQIATATASVTDTLFAPGSQLGGDYRFQATRPGPVTTTILSATPVAVFTGLVAATYTITVARMGVDDTTVLATPISSAGHVLSGDVIIAIPTALQVLIESQ